jgi:AAA domain
VRVASLKLTNFRRFTDLEIRDIPQTVKLVVLAGPNGSGKSSIFDALLTHYRVKSQYGPSGDIGYYNRSNDPHQRYFERVVVNTHDGIIFTRGSLYVRSAYRHDPDFMTNSLARQGDILETLNLIRLIEADATVARNYARLASKPWKNVGPIVKAGHDCLRRPQARSLRLMVHELQPSAPFREWQARSYSKGHRGKLGILTMAAVAILTFSLSDGRSEIGPHANAQGFARGATAEPPSFNEGWRRDANSTRKK